MKKMMTALIVMLTIAASGKAMSFEQARNEALFLTDKMAYELNLTDEQYEAAYEINLDYLMGVTSYDDVFGNYWERRNLDMSYVLLDWQWRTFCAATYFYRPLYWSDGFWHFGIYARYPHRDYFYFGRPVFYASYRGGHAWHVVGGRGWYHARRDHFRPVGRTHFGMLDRWNRGDFRHHHARIGNSRPGFNGGGVRHSSTRTTVNRHHNSNAGHFSNGRHTYQNSTFHNGSNRGSNGSFGHSGATQDNSTRSYSSFGGGNSSSSHSNGSFGGRATRSGSFGNGATRSGSFGGGASRGGSFGGGATRGGSGSFSGGGNRGGGGGTFSRGR